MCVCVGVNQQKGKGLIDREDLRAVCQQFQLSVGEPVLDALMDDCDADKDGFISFLEFANFLNWKDKMPISSGEQSVITNGTIDLICLFQAKSNSSITEPLKPTE